MKDNNRFHNSEKAIFAMGRELFYMNPQYTNLSTEKGFFLREKSLINTMVESIYSYFNIENTIKNKDEVIAFIEEKLEKYSGG